MTACPSATRPPPAQPPSPAGVESLMVLPSHCICPCEPITHVQNGSSRLQAGLLSLVCPSMLGTHGCRCWLPGPPVTALPHHHCTLMLQKSLSKWDAHSFCGSLALRGMSVTRAPCRRQEGTGPHGESCKDPFSWDQHIPKGSSLCGGIHKHQPPPPSVGASAGLSRAPRPAWESCVGL